MEPLGPDRARLTVRITFTLPLGLVCEVPNTSGRDADRAPGGVRIWRI